MSENIVRLDNPGTVLAPLAPWNAGAPKINGPKVFGATPGRFFSYTFPVRGDRDGLVLSVAGNLPEGLAFDAATGTLSGKCDAGEYRLSVSAQNRLGGDSVTFTLMVGENMLARTPPMGWTSWNALTTHVKREHLLAAAHAMIDEGLAARGYTYVNVDSGWQGQRDFDYDGNSALQPNEFFPDIAGMVSEIHGLGLKCGLYCSPMVLCCGTDLRRQYRGCTDFPIDPELTQNLRWPFVGIGKKRFEKIDAAQWAEWKFDFLKYDWPFTDVAQAKMMREALDATDRDFLLQLCTGCDCARAEEYRNVGQLIRGYADTRDNWGAIGRISKHADIWLDYVGPGYWYDLDMFALGRMMLNRPATGAEMKGRRGLPDDTRFNNWMNQDEQAFHFVYWIVFPTPLFLSCDLTSLDDFTRDLVGNEELIEINQDYPAKAAAFEDRPDEVRVATRRLSDGRMVWAFFNYSEEPRSFVFPLGGEYALRDPMGGRDLGSGDSLDIALPIHGVKIAVGRAVR